MAIQQHINRCLVLAGLSAVLWIRFVQRSPLVLVLAFPLSLISLVALVILYHIFILPRISPLRYLPSAPQAPLGQRLFKEPGPFQFERWINTVPNNGLIRYFGFLNTEKILVTSPEGVRQVLQAQAYNFEKQYAQKMHLEHISGKGLVWQDGDGHKRQRKVMNVAFKRKNITAWHAIFWHKASEMVDAACAQAATQERNCSSTSKSRQNGPSVNFSELVNRTIFDIMSLTSTGLDLKAVTHPERMYNKLSAYRQSFEPTKSVRNRIMASFIFPQWIIEILPLKTNRLSKKPIADLRRLADKFLANMVTEEVGPVLVPNILKTVYEEQEFSYEELVDTFLTLQAGGTHATSVTVLSAIFFLAQPKHYHIQQKLREEILQTQSSKDCGNSFDKMPYLDALTNEVLRMHSGFSWLGRQPLKPITVCGSTLPAGVAVSLSPWALHRSEELWGPDAKEFRPERWLEAGGVPTNRHTWLAWGGGPRICIGQKFATAAFKCIISTTFRRLDIRFDTESELPRVTHQMALSFKTALKPTVRVLA